MMILSCLGLSSCAGQPPTRQTPDSQPASEGTRTLLVAATGLPPVVPTPNPAQGEIYYVATWGNDANPGTDRSPWQTLDKGISALTAGDTLYIKSGQYIQTAPLKISVSGDDADGPITISTAPGEPTPAVITGDADGDGKADAPARIYDGLVELRGSYLHFEDLEIVNSGGRGILSSGNHNVILGNNVHHIWNAGIYVGSADNTIEANRVWRTADSNYCDGALGRLCNGDWSGGIGWGDPHDPTSPGIAPRTVVRNNTVFNVSGEGIICMHSDGGLIEGNVVYDNWALNIDLDQCSFITIQHNLAYYTDDVVWWKQPDRPGSGILLSNEGISDREGRTYPVGHERKVINNILVGNGINLSFWTADQGPAGSALVNDVIAYNTLVEPQGKYNANMKIDAGPHADTRIANNLFFQSSGTIAYVETTAGITFAHNLWSFSPSPKIATRSDVFADPRLVDPTHDRLPGSVQAEWYRLSGKSPAIGKGLAMMEVSVDYWNNPRGSMPDIGAHQYQPGQ